VDFLGEPCLTVPGTNALKVGSKLLINLEFNIILQNRHLLHALGENVSEDHAKNNNAANHEEGQRLVTRGPHSVLNLHGSGLVNERNNLGLEDLHVTHAPVPKEEQKQGSDMHNIEGALVQLVVVHGWALIVVGDQELLANVV